jgi:hypothetical protein
MKYKNRVVYVLAVVAAAVSWCSADAAAQTLYKLIDKSGKVTYSESPPKEFDGKVIRMDIDPKANTATLPKPSAESPAARSGAGNSGGGGADKVQLAREKLDAAKKALQNAQENPREDEVQRVGNKGGFARPVPTEAYQQRIAGLEEAVRKAEEELRVAQGN